MAQQHSSLFTLRCSLPCHSAEEEGSRTVAARARGGARSAGEAHLQQRAGGALDPQSDGRREDVKVHVPSSHVRLERHSQLDLVARLRPLEAALGAAGGSLVVQALPYPPEEVGGRHGLVRAAGAAAAAASGPLEQPRGHAREEEGGQQQAGGTGEEERGARVVAAHTYVRMSYVCIECGRFSAVYCNTGQAAVTPRPSLRSRHSPSPRPLAAAELQHRQLPALATRDHPSKTQRQASGVRRQDGAHCRHRNNNALLCVTENRIALPLARTPEAPQLGTATHIMLLLCIHVGHLFPDGPPALVARSSVGGLLPCFRPGETQSRRGTHSSDSVHSANPEESGAGVTPHPRTRDIAHEMRIPLRPLRMSKSYRRLRKRSHRLESV